MTDFTAKRFAMSTMKQLTALTGYSRDKINKLISRKIMLSELPPVDPGAPREFSKQNFLELAYLSALEQCGVDLTTAGIVARHWIAEEESNGGRGWSYFAWHPGKGILQNGRVTGYSYMNPGLPAFEIANQLADVPTGYADRNRAGEIIKDEAVAFVVINLMFIRERVGAIFAKVKEAV